MQSRVARCLCSQVTEFLVFHSRNCLLVSFVFSAGRADGEQPECCQYLTATLRHCLNRKSPCPQPYVTFVFLLCLCLCSAQLVIITLGLFVLFFFQRRIIEPIISRRRLQCALLFIASDVFLGRLPAVCVSRFHSGVNSEAWRSSRQPNGCCDNWRSSDASSRLSHRRFRTHNGA